MGDLITFLSARRDEDEALARHAGGREWRTGCTCQGECPGYPPCERVEGDDITIYNEGGHDASQAEHIARHDPARVLREVEAGRALIAEHERAWKKAPGNLPLINTLTRLMRVLAAVYSDHPDYQPEWAVA